ncbi:hypothetical protein COL922a_013126 [Colletotrichum nupharicola]|nr:hypothetical protein COL922a_013126 [Colletotrichum nupharicola]
MADSSHAPRSPEAPPTAKAPSPRAEATPPKSKTASPRSAGSPEAEIPGQTTGTATQQAEIEVDEGDELDRLDFNASFLTKLTQNQLHHAPLEQGKVHRILDIGTGTGIFARVPPNVKFEVDDVESPWVAPKYDFIYCRFMAGAIADWPRLVKNTFKNTHPGGWVEFQDWDLLFKSDDGSLTDDHYSMKMIKMFMEGSRKVGREPQPGPLLEPLMREAGFVNIHHKQINAPSACGQRNRISETSGT